MTVPRIRSIGVTISGLLAIAVLGCSGDDRAGSGIDDRIPVFTATVESTDLIVRRSYSGTVEGNRQATVYARIPETVQQVLVVKGDRVSRGDLLVRFDASGPNSSIRQARAIAEYARKRAERYQRLFEQGAVSELERDAIQTEYDVARSNHEAARDQISVTTPIGGLVTEVYAREGRQLTIGQPLVQIAAIDTVRVLVDVSVYESAEIRESQPVVIRSELDTALSAEGVIAEVSRSADRESRNVSVEILAENRGRKLLPGLFVRADIEIERRLGVRSVPRDALVFRQDGLGLFVVRDSTAHFIPVTIGIESGDRVELIDGPETGMTVVTLGQNNLQDGTRVNPISETQTQQSGQNNP
jgi:membrane fusion protein, multidrug efflux system